MPMSVEEAVAIANRIRGTNGQFDFPHDQPVGKLAEAMQVLAVGLKRYRKVTAEFKESVVTIETGK